MNKYSSVQSQKAVTAYFTSEQLQPFDFTHQYGDKRVYTARKTTNHAHSESGGTDAAKSWSNRIGSEMKTRHFNLVSWGEIF